MACIHNDSAVIGEESNNMFFGNRRTKIIERNDLWYLETQSGYEGPFDTRSEAKQYQSLQQRAEMARVEFAGIEDSLYKT